MLNAWHLPVAPFVKQNKDQLTITLWLAGENPPLRVTLRAENDNEEISLAMHKQRSQPQPGVTAWRAALDLSSGQPRRRYSFKLLWLDRQLWFTPQGFSRFPPARLEQFAVDVPDNGPSVGLPIRFSIKFSRTVLPAASRVKRARITSITTTPPDTTSYGANGMNRLRLRPVAPRSMAVIWTASAKSYRT